MKKRIVTVAVTGSMVTSTMSPYLPITPEQITSKILAVHKAGGTVCHVHVKDPKTDMPVSDLSLFRQIADAVKRKCDIVLCFSTGGGQG